MSEAGNRHALALHFRPASEARETGGTRHVILTQEKPFAHHARMIGAGFLVGSLITIPGAIIASGRLSTSDHASREPVVNEVSLAADTSSRQTAAPARSATDAGMLPVVPVATANTTAATLEPKPLAPRIVKTERVEPTAEEVARRAREERVETARTLIVRGEVARAREILAKDDGDPAAAFVLAEAFDPNVLASLNLTGVRSEVERARELYRKALAGGVSAAQQRLDALQ